MLSICIMRAGIILTRRALDLLSSSADAAARAVPLHEARWGNLLRCAFTIATGGIQSADYVAELRQTPIDGSPPALQSYQACRSRLGRMSEQ